MLQIPHISQFYPTAEGVWVVGENSLSLIKKPFFQNFTQIPRGPVNFSLSSDSSVYIAYGKAYKASPNKEGWKVSDIELDPERWGILHPFVKILGDCG